MSEVSDLLLRVLPKLGHEYTNRLQCPRRTAPVRGECVCGAEAVMRDVVGMLGELGVPPRVIWDALGALDGGGGAP